MRNFFFCIFLFLTNLSAFSQYGNDWINFDKTYYKFKVAQDGIYRIPYNLLVNEGISPGSLIGSDFQLFYLGKEQPIYVSTEGEFQSTDFIEFFGKQNDGTPDTELFVKPEDQVHKDYSLFTDSSTYFLTLNTGGNNQRLNNIANDLTGAPSPEPFYMHEEKVTAINRLNEGIPTSLPLPTLYDSRFLEGESWSSNPYVDSTAITFPVSNVYRSGPQNFSYQTSQYSLSFGNYFLKTRIGNFKKNTPYTNYGTTQITDNVPLNILSDGNNILYIVPSSSAARNIHFQSTLTYPRTFDFTAKRTAVFNIEKTQDLVLNIQNFDWQAGRGLIYDLNNNLRIEISNPSTSTLVRLPSRPTNSSIYISNTSLSNLRIINKIQSVEFKNFSELINQGNYIFLTHTSLTQPLDGINYVDEYVEHRSSTLGGAYQVAKVFIDEIEDQFGYGISTHPLSIRRFVNFAIDNWSISPEFLFICGKGLPYTDTRRSAANYRVNLISPYGSPPSDNLLTARNSESSDPQLAVGRLSARNNEELKIYFDKITEYDEVRNDTSFAAQNIGDKAWMKRVLHLGGGNTANEQALFSIFLDRYKNIIEGPKFGAEVSSIFKSSSDPIQIAQSVFLDSLITNGISLMTFFGHSSTNSLDFNLQPESYNNKGRYYMMLSNGCLVGSIFERNRSFSERFIVTKDRGAIAYIAPLNFAVTTSLNRYSTKFYENYSLEFYNEAIGKTIDASASFLGNINLPLDEMLAQQMTFHGDPGINMNGHSRPDYVLEERFITCTPDIVSASIDTFKLNIELVNIGRAVSQEFTVSVERVFPNGDFETYSEVVKAPLFRDSIAIDIVTDRIRGLGENTFTIKVDANDEISEISEDNNEVVIKKIILAEDLLPITPYNFCIINQRPTLKFSTANSLAESATYILEIDTTELFNSPIVEQNEVTSIGGVIEWTPTSIPFIENTVYYYRSAFKSNDESMINFSNSSFLFNSSLSSGWNQSHYFQFIKNKFQTLEISPFRQWKFADDLRTVRLLTGIYNSPINKNNITFFVDNVQVARNSYATNGFLFYVYNKNTGQALQSVANGCVGTYGDLNCFSGGPIEIIAFNAQTAAQRKTIIDFIYNDIPTGSIVMCYSHQATNYPQLWDGWEEDGSDTTLYDAFEYLGAKKIRSVSGLSPYVFFTDFGNPSFESTEIVGVSNEVIDTTLVFAGLWDRGAVRSTIVGPAKDWKTLDIDWTPQEASSNDETYFNIYGIPKGGGFVPIIQNTVDVATRDLSVIDAGEYPELYLEMFSKDETLSTPSEINHWRVFYDKIPEAALNQKIDFFLSNDTINRGDEIFIRIAAENISTIDMDSILVKFNITDGKNNTFEEYKRYAPLPANKHILIENAFTFEGFNSEGDNVIVIEMNPDNDQIEQFHFNNFAIIPINVALDKENPILDVTFDGDHILDGDIVSAKPEILISLNDENKFLPLNDSNAFELFIIYPNDKDNPRLIDPSDDQVEFIPARKDNLGRKNEARLYYRPTFEEDGIYELRVQGIDRSNNESGQYDYRVKFEVINKPSITNFVNYPNPFSTSTRFVFTLTGSEIPEDILIKIYTISGRVVREISASELGALKIGNNITDFAWDGRDEFGDQLANGVYLYSVKVKLQGTTLEHRSTSADQYFKKSIGKMYLMR